MRLHCDISLHKPPRKNLPGESLASVWGFLWVSLGSIQTVAAVTSM